MQNNNPLTEIILGIIAVLFIAGGVFLLYVGKIDFAGATLMFGFPAALFGINQALKAPSPGQQANMQQLVSDLTTTMRVNFQHTHAAPSAPPVVAPPTQPAQPVPFMPIPAAAAQSPVPQPPTSTLPWIGQQQPFPTDTGRFPAPQQQQ